MQLMVMIALQDETDDSVKSCLNKARMKLILRSTFTAEEHNMTWFATKPCTVLFKPSTLGCETEPPYLKSGRILSIKKLQIT
jgi:hypothetical protein